MPAQGTRPCRRRRGQHNLVYESYLEGSPDEVNAASPDVTQW